MSYSIFLVSEFHFFSGNKECVMCGEAKSVIIMVKNANTIDLHLMVPNETSKEI